MSGARAKIGFSDGGNTSYVGVYSNFSYGVMYDVAPAFILGRYSAASLDYTAMNPVSCTATGYRIVDHGPHQAEGGRVPRLQQLLNFDDLTIQVVDRLSNKAIATIKNAKPTGYNTGLSARQLEEMTMGYTGLLVDDESGASAEPASSLDLP